MTNLPKNAEVGRIYAIAGTGVIAKPRGGRWRARAERLESLSLIRWRRMPRGNIYIADYADDALRVLYAGGSVPNLPANPVVGNLYTIAGTLNQPCNDSAPADPNECGDHGQSVNALLSSPEGVAGGLPRAISTSATIRMIVSARYLCGRDGAGAYQSRGGRDIHVCRQWAVLDHGAEWRACDRERNLAEHDRYRQGGQPVCKRFGEPDHSPHRYGRA